MPHRLILDEVSAGAVRVLLRRAGQDLEEGFGDCPVGC